MARRLVRRKRSLRLWSDGVRGKDQRVWVGLTGGALTWGGSSAGVCFETPEQTLCLDLEGGFTGGGAFGEYVEVTTVPKSQLWDNFLSSPWPLGDTSVCMMLMALSKKKKVWPFSE